MSVRAFIEYLKFEKKYAKSTLRAYEDDLTSFEQFVAENIEATPIENCHYTEIRHWIVTLVDSGMRNISVNRKVSALKSYYNFLLKTEQIEQNPLRKHQPLKIEKKVRIPFSQSEIAEVLKVLDHPNTFLEFRDKLIIELLYSTGMRRAELIGLKLNDFDLSQKTVKVLGKRNKERYIPLLNTVVATILEYTKHRTKQYSKTDHFFITSKGEKMYPTLVYRIINEYFSKVSLKSKKSPHIIRHSFATHLLNEGADLNSVKELLGHSSLASTQVYTHNNLKELKNTYNKAHPRSTNKNN